MYKVLNVKDAGNNPHSIAFNYVQEKRCAIVDTVLFTNHEVQLKGLTKRKKQAWLIMEEGVGRRGDYDGNNLTD